MKAFLVSGAVALVAATSAYAHFETGRFTHSRCAGTAESRVDPINVVFWDWATWDRAADQLAAHAGWTNASGSEQFFFDHGSCHAMSGQRASGGASSTRFHIRVHPVHWDSQLGWTAVGDAHHEDLVFPCGHAVDANGPAGSGFDQGRRELRARMEQGGHGWRSEWWGNTANFRQCDGDYAGSDGYTVFVRVHEAADR